MEKEKIKIWIRNEKTPTGNIAYIYKERPRKSWEEGPWDESSLLCKFRGLGEILGIPVNMCHEIVVEHGEYGFFWETPKIEDIKMACQEKVEAYKEYIDKILRVLDYDPEECLISDRSTFRDFAIQNDNVPGKIKLKLGIDVALEETLVEGARKLKKKEGS